MSMPQFGSPAGTPPTQPMTPPAFGAPAMPPAAGPVPSFVSAPVAAQGPGLGSQLATMIPALLMGLKDPLSMGAAMRGIQKARDRAMAQRETAQENADRKARERVDFYSRMLENAAQFDDEIEFTDWKRAIAPVAEYHGIPVASVTFNAGKGAAKERRVVQDAIDQAIKRHGAEVLNRDDISVQLPDGRSMSMATARQLIGGEVTAAGARVPVPKSERPLIAHDPTRALVNPITGEVVTPATAGPTSDDQEWVIRGGVVTPIRKGTRQIGDRPYQAPSQAQPREPRDPDYITLSHPNGRQTQVAKGPDANALLAQGWHVHDPVAVRQQNGAGDPANEALETANEIVRIATALRDSPGFNGAFGVLSARMPTARQSTADAEVLLGSLRSLMTLENTGKLKGVLSNADMELLRQASSTIAAEMSESSARAELKRLIEVTGKAAAALETRADVPPHVDPRQSVLPPARRGGAGPTGTPAAAETPEQRGARLLFKLTEATPVDDKKTTAPSPLTTAELIRKYAK